ncbi:MAG: pyrroline-5-carboxylate reductase [Eubacterium sp.]|nr:pyrroline-5-carboxylate reductase [Eubacterium sp.]
MMKTIGFIGCGNMGSAIIGGIINAKIADGEHIIAYAPTNTHLDVLKEKYGINSRPNNWDVAREADILFLAVKPNKLSEVIPDISGSLKKGAVVVSIVAGTTMSAIEKLFCRELKLVRSMPNTPALVGEAMSAICGNSHMEDEELEDIKKIFESFGKCEIVPESLMDAVTGVSGSSPAYVYMFIEAMADAAVADGMPRNQAYKFAAQAVYGSAKMVLETGLHPGVLKDNVCSPGGTTIEAVAELEKGGLRSTVISAQRACVKKSKNM